MPTVEAAPYVDAVALTDTDRSSLTVMLVNTHPDRPIKTTVELRHWPEPTSVTARQLTGPSFMARNSIEQPNVVGLHKPETPPTITTGRIDCTLPPHSITALRME